MDILIVDDQDADALSDTCLSMDEICAAEGGGDTVNIARTLGEANRLLQGSIPDVVLLDALFPSDDLDPYRTPFLAGEFLSELDRRCEESKSALPGVLLLSSQAETADHLPEIAAWIDRGRIDFFILKDPASQLFRALLKDRVKRIRRELAMRPTPSEAKSSLRQLGICAEDPKITALWEVMTRVAQTKTTVLIRGEVGVGKSRFAQAIHDASPRRDGPFVELNCAAFPESLLEAELFGVGEESGLPNVGRQGRPGKIDMAIGGTLFLDEIGDMNPVLQTKVLHLLEGKPFYRATGNTPIHADIRIITATNQDLAARVTAGAFNSALYSRIKVVEIEIPPLRERRRDIPDLVEYFLAGANRREKRNVKITAEVREGLHAYDWRDGNVREIKNAIEALVAASDPHATVGVSEWDDLTKLGLPRIENLPARNVAVLREGEEQEFMDQLNKEWNSDNNNLRTWQQLSSKVVDTCLDMASRRSMALNRLRQAMDNRPNNNPNSIHLKKLLLALLLDSNNEVRQPQLTRILETTSGGQLRNIRKAFPQLFEELKEPSQRSESGFSVQIVPENEQNGEGESSFLGCLKIKDDRSQLELKYARHSGQNIYQLELNPIDDGI